MFVLVCLKVIWLIIFLQMVILKLKCGLKIICLSHVLLLLVLLLKVLLMICLLNIVVVQMNLLLIMLFAFLLYVMLLLLILRNLKKSIMSRFKYLFVVGVFLQLLTFVFDFDIGYSLAIAPLAIGTLAAAGGAALSDLTNQINRSNAQYQVDLQKQLMDYQWKNYQSPKAQAKGLAEAGLNPSVVFGQGSMSHSATPTPSSVPVSPVDIGSSGADLTQAILAMAQAKKAGAETVAQNLENDITKSTFDEKVKAIGLQNKWTEEQTAKISQEIGLMSGQFNELQQKIENMKSEKALTDKQVSWFDRHMKAEIDDLKASADYKKAMEGLTDSQKELLDRTMDDLCNITNLNAQQMEKIVSLLDKYGDAQAIVGMLSQAVGAASNLIGNFIAPTKVNKIIKNIKVE